MRTLLVASAGGHLDELVILAPTLGIDLERALWVTSRSPQTESLLAGKSVTWVPHVGSGEFVKALSRVPSALRLHRRLRPELVVSTGAAQAVPHLIAASTLGCRTTYVESATRLHGPSRTGQVAARLPRASLFAQGAGWGDRRWQSTPSVFDQFVVTPRTSQVGDPSSAVLSLGSERYPFGRAVSAVLAVLPPAAVTWQTGSTVHALPDGSLLRQWVPADELRAAFAAADVVVCHGGVGSVLAALGVGKVPVVLTRTATHGEHIDDHQVEIAEMLARRGLVVLADPDTLSSEHLRAAAALSVTRVVPGD
ncbi:putative Glycosyltransferase 28 domain [metagenome]|uniref:Putative Glycosyltransferase 28 domain n=1 Tax=metagenome TaxID=256318 RepID=A0A2P2BZB7_9ZZZZ